jgi:hypothetical protein
MPVERQGRFATANPDALNRWLASQAHSPEPFHIVHTGEHNLVDDPVNSDQNSDHRAQTMK